MDMKNSRLFLSEILLIKYQSKSFYKNKKYLFIFIETFFVWKILDFIMLKRRENTTLDKNKYTCNYKSNVNVFC